MMLGLASLLGAATLAVTLAEVEAHASPARTLQDRQINKFDIVRRATRVKRQSGPSALPPQPAPQFCGDTEVGTAFFITTPDPTFPERFLYAAVNDGDLISSDASYYRFEENPEDATTFFFNSDCQMRRTADGTEGYAYISSDYAVSPVYIGTLDFIDTTEDGNTVTCSTTDGVLDCGIPRFDRKRIITDWEFCTVMSAGKHVLHMKSANDEDPDCLPVQLSARTTLPPQPPRRCGDIEVGQPWYMTATLSVNGNNNGGVLYYPYAPSNMIEQNGAVEFYLSFDSAMAVPFAFDDNCHLSRPNIAYGADKSFAYDGQFHTSLRMGTEAFVNQGSAGNIAPVTCRSTAGVLKCGAGHDFIPLGLTTFCQSGSLLYLSSMIPNFAGCFPMTVQTSATLPELP